MQSVFVSIPSVHSDLVSRQHIPLIRVELYRPGNCVFVFTSFRNPSSCSHATQNSPSRPPRYAWRRTSSLSGHTEPSPICLLNGSPPAYFFSIHPLQYFLQTSGQLDKFETFVFFPSSSSWSSFYSYFYLYLFSVSQYMHRSQCLKKRRPPLRDPDPQRAP